jgi:hypothetical protein
MPLLVISPFSRVNQVDHRVVDQASILRFIEDNWETGQIGDSSFDNIPSPKPTIAGMFDFSPGAERAPKLALDPVTGNPPEGSGPAPPPGVTPRAPLAFSARVKPTRDRKAPYIFVLSGKLKPPAGAGCGGKVSVSVKAGSKTVTTPRAKVKASCAWTLKLRFSNKKRLGNGKLTLRTSFLGTSDVLSRKAKTLKVRAG